MAGQQEFNLLAKLSPDVDDSEIKSARRKVERGVTSDPLELGVEVDRRKLKEAQQDAMGGWGPGPAERAAGRAKSAARTGGRLAGRGAKFAGHVAVTKLMRKLGIPTTIPSTSLGSIFGGSSGGSAGPPTAAEGSTAADPDELIPVLQSQLAVQEEILEEVKHGGGGGSGSGGGFGSLGMGAMLSRGLGKGKGLLGGLLSKGWGLLKKGGGMMKKMGPLMKNFGLGSLILGPTIATLAQRIDRLDFSDLSELLIGKADDTAKEQAEDAKDGPDGLSGHRRRPPDAPHIWGLPRNPEDVQHTPGGGHIPGAPEDWRDDVGGGGGGGGGGTPGGPRIDTGVPPGGHRPGGRGNAASEHPNQRQKVEQPQNITVENHYHIDAGSIRKIRKQAARGAEESIQQIGQELGVSGSGVSTAGRY